MVGRTGKDFDSRLQAYSVTRLMTEAQYSVTKRVRVNTQKFLKHNCIINTGTLASFAQPSEGEGVSLLDLDHNYALALLDEAGQATEVSTYAVLLPMVKS